MVPAWLNGLINEEEFFTHCEFHEKVDYNLKAYFCPDCCRSLCQNCVVCHNTSHTHNIVQVRRTSSEEFITLEELRKLLISRSIQIIRVYGEESINLKPPQPCSDTGKRNCCLYCDNNIQCKFSFCSLSCKVKNAEKHGGDELEELLSSIEYKPKERSSRSQPTQAPEIEGSSSNSHETGEGSSSSSSINRKNNRRKGNPQRAPLQ